MTPEQIIESRAIANQVGDEFHCAACEARTFATQLALGSALDEVERLQEETRKLKARLAGMILGDAP